MKFLQDILATIADIETFMANIELDSFRANRKNTLAVVKSSEILAEAVNQIPDAIRYQYPDLP